MHIVPLVAVGPLAAVAWASVAGALGDPCLCLVSDPNLHLHAYSLPGRRHPTETRFFCTTGDYTPLDALTCRHSAAHLARVRALLGLCLACCVAYFGAVCGDRADQLPWRQLDLFGLPADLTQFCA